MRKLILKVLRELWRIKKRSCAIGLIIALGVSIYAGTYIGLDTIGYTAYSLYNELHFADFQISFIPTIKEEVPIDEVVKKISGIKRIDSRLILPGSIELSNGRVIASLFIFLNANSLPTVNSLKIISGEYFVRNKNEAEGVVIDAGFAKEHGYKVGDMITIEIQGFFSNFRISGIAINPEFLIRTSNPNFYYPIKGSLGIVYLPMETIRKIFGYEIINNLSFTFDEKIDPKEIKNSIKDILDRKVDIINEISKEDQYSHKSIEIDLKIFSTLLPTIIAIFDIIAFLITFMVVKRMVYTQKKEIGILMALGYTTKSILSSYLLVGGILGILGSMIGCIGSIGVSFLVTQAYIRGEGFPIIIYHFSSLPLIKAFFLGVTATITASFLPTYKIIKMNPACIIRDDIGTFLGAIPLFYQKIEEFFNKVFKFSISFKLGFRNLIRRKELLVSSTTCIAFSLALAISFMIVNTSIFQTNNKYFFKEKWDVTVSFDEPVEKESLSKIKNLNGIEIIAPFLKGFVKIKYNDVEKPYQIVGTDLNSKVRDFDLLCGTTFKSEDSLEIILNKEMADSLGIKIGQKLKIVSESKEIPMVLVGIVNNFVVGQAFIPIKTSQEILKLQDKFSGALIKTFRPPKILEKDLYKIDFVSHVISKEDVKDSVKQMTSEVSNFLYLYTIFGIIVAVIIIFTILFINIMDREIEYAILQSIGYGKGIIFKTLLVEVGIIAILATIITIPLSIVIAHIISYQIGKSAYIIKIYLHTFDFFKTLIPAFLLILISAYIGLKQIFQINIPTVIKNKIIG